MVHVGHISWDRMLHAVEKVRNRLTRAAVALQQAGIPYAVAGGNAVAAWVSRVDEAAVRNTQDVDFLIRRADLEKAKEAMTAAGFVYRHVRGVDMFLDGPAAKPRDAVHLLFAGEKVRPEHPTAAPDVDAVEDDPAFRLLALESLVRMKLAAFRDKDRMHLRDLIAVELVDATWTARYEPVLASRLQELLDNPEE